MLKTTSDTITYRVMRAAAYILLAFYVLSLVSMASAAVAPKGLLPWFSLVFGEDANRVLQGATEKRTDIDDAWLRAAESLHRGNPAVIGTLARYYIRDGNSEEARRLAERVVALDPTGFDGYALRAEAAKAENAPLTLVDEAKALTFPFLGSVFARRVSQGLVEHPPRLIDETRNKRIDYNRYASNRPQDLLARLYYLFGYSLLGADNEGVVYWWNLATDADPGSSYFPVETADAYALLLSDKERAVAVLSKCSANQYAKKHCEDTKGDVERGFVVDPGYYHTILFKGLFFLHE